MTQSKAIPEDQTAAIPHLCVREAARAVAFYVSAFGAVEAFRLTEPSGRVGHAELTIGKARFMLADEYPEMAIVGPLTLGGTAVRIHIYVEDVDALAARALAAGATLEGAVSDQFYGDRVARLKDPFGHQWTFASRIEAVSPEEMQKRFSAMMGG